MQAWAPWPTQAPELCTVCRPYPALPAHAPFAALTESLYPWKGVTAACNNSIINAAPAGQWYRGNQDPPYANVQARVRQGKVLQGGAGQVGLSDAQRAEGRPPKLPPPSILPPTGRTPPLLCGQSSSSRWSFTSEWSPAGGTTGVRTAHLQLEASCCALLLLPCANPHELAGCCRLHARSLQVHALLAGVRSCR